MVKGVDAGICIDVHVCGIRLAVVARPAEACKDQAKPARQHARSAKQRVGSGFSGDGRIEWSVFQRHLGQHDVFRESDRNSDG